MDCEVHVQTLTAVLLFVGVHGRAGTAATATIMIVVMNAVIRPNTACGRSKR